MALDISLFTLTFQRRNNDATILDLLPFHPAAIAASPTSPLYSFSRAQSSNYDVQLVDHLTSIPLSSITAPSSSDKIRKIQLYNPDDAVIFEKRNMTFRQEWRWTWQSQEYLARRDGRAYIVEAVRKPDPEIDIARYTPGTKTRPAFLQILDYNIQRLEVNDRRGLEVLILTVICTLLDVEYDEKHKDDPSGNIHLPGGLLTSSSLTTNGRDTLSNADNSTAATQIASQQQPSEANEIYIDMHTPIDVYVQHALRLMRQDQDGEGLHLIILKASSPQLTPKVVSLAAEIKARWYRLEPVAKGRTLDPLPGSSSEIAEELYQYVRDPSLQNTTSATASSSSALIPSKESSNSSSTSPGPRPRIKLDAPISPPRTSPSPVSGHASPIKNQQIKSFAPPPNELDIYLSKERIDEFEVGLSKHTTTTTIGSHRHPQVSSPGRMSPSKTPVVPPKVTSYGKHQSRPSDGSSGGAKKILGKLGLLKGHPTET